MNKVVNATSTRVLPVLFAEPMPVERGDVFDHVMSSGGGYGPSREREPERVLQDVMVEKVSVEGASRDYGVAIRQIGPDQYQIDLAETERLRALPMRQNKEEDETGSTFERL